MMFLVNIFNQQTSADGIESLILFTRI